MQITNLLLADGSVLCKLSLLDTKLWDLSLELRDFGM